MSFLDAYIDEEPAYGWQGGMRFKTRIVEVNGDEARNAMWIEGKHEFSVPYSNITIEQYRRVKKMHMVCRGSLHVFRHIDVLDDEADNEIFAEGDGTTLVFQLRKISSIDGISYARNCYAIRSAAITADVAPVSPTVDMRRGTVTFSVAPGDGVILRWTGFFDVWVRFNQDYLPFSLDQLDAVNGTIDLLEHRPPREGE